MKYDIDKINPPTLSHDERRGQAAALEAYLATETPEDREVPGYEDVVSKWERHRQGKDESGGERGREWKQSEQPAQSWALSIFFNYIKLNYITFNL